MTNKQINAINGYFNDKHMDRKQLELVLDFDNLTIDKKYIPEIRELLKSSEDESGEDVLKSYVRFVKARSGSGEITWDEFMARLNDLAVVYSSLSEDEKDIMISALDAIYSTHYVDKSRVDIMKSSINKITMTNADLVPEVGLRDYGIEFLDGDFISLRF